MTSSPHAHILIADDDRELCELLADFLRREGYSVDAVHDAEAALAKTGSAARPDILILDVMLPGMSGLTALQRLREQDPLPVIMLSGRGEPEDRVIGLDLGADDYLAKPCLPRELLSRIQALLRRTRVRSDSEAAFGELRLRASERKAFVGATELVLTGAEFAVLLELVRQKGLLVSRELLTEKALNRSLERYDRAIDVHISRLRRKLADVAAPLVIEGVRGAGYQLMVKS
jgi:DNA-binding response OmpR family regulator